MTARVTYFVALVAVLVAVPAARADERLSALSVSAEQARFDALGVGFDQDGNAAELYLPYLNGKAGLTQTAWFHQVSLDAIGEGGRAEPEMISRAVKDADPDLAALVSASHRKFCQLWGVYWRPRQDKLILSQDNPEYLNIYRLTLLAIARGDERAAAGRFEQARQDYAAALRVGHHLEGEPELFAYVVGLEIKEKAARRLAHACAALGQNDSAEKLEIYADVTADRVQAKNRMLGACPSWDRQQVAEFVLDKDMPFSMRLDLLVSRHYCLHDDVILLRCAVIGPPIWVTELEKKLAAENELAASFSSALANSRADLKWLQ